jgi:hypothetical protein
MISMMQGGPATQKKYLFGVWGFPNMHIISCCFSSVIFRRASRRYHVPLVNNLGFMQLKYEVIYCVWY